jgi:hypothetical protein
MVEFTIFCTACPAFNGALLGDLGRDNLRVLTSDLASLRADVALASEKGPVLVVARGAREASYALGLGVDEVIRAQGVTRESLDQAMDRARKRADMRLAYRFGCTAAEYSALRGFGLLITSVLQEVSQPLRLALLKSTILNEEMARIQATQHLLGSDADTMPIQRMQTLSRLATSATRMEKLVQQQRCMLERAESFLSVFETCKDDADEGTNDVGVLLGQVAELMRGEVRESADIRVETEHFCIAATSRPFLVCLVSIVIAQAVDLLRHAGHAKGRVDLRASEAEDVVVVEVEYAGAPAAPACLLKGVHECLLSIKGDLLIDSNETRTIVRLLLPRLLGAHGAPMVESRAVQPLVE